MLDIKEIQTIEHDVVIIGAGGAGIRAAIECAQMGMNTGMISKSLLGKAHTVMAEGGMAAVYEPISDNKFKIVQLQQVEDIWKEFNRIFGGSKYV